MISVCIATYNGQLYLKQQLDSILPQLSANDEIVISDDSSSDDTIKIISSFDDSRILFLAKQHFQSPVYNFENSLRHANGDYIFLSDQDDIWKPDKVEVFMKQMKTYDLVLSDCEVISSDGKVIHPSFYELNKSHSGLFTNILRNSYLGCCMAFKKEVLIKALPFPKNLPMHDWWLGLIAEAFYKTTFISDKLIKYRRHELNASSTAGKSNNSLTQKITFRIKMVWELIKVSF
jgi:glycosyltransferase involved in cell wall biosynthesis